MYFRLVYKSQTRAAEPLHSCASLQVLFDLGRVFAVETLCLLVELSVPLVDVIDVGVVVVGPASAVLGPLLDPARKKKKKKTSQKGVASGKSLVQSATLSLVAFSNK